MEAVTKHVLKFARAHRLALIVAYVCIDFLLGNCAGVFPQTTLQASAQTGPAQPVTASQITFPLFTVNITPVSQSSVTLIGNPGNASYCYWLVTNYLVGSLSPVLAGCVFSAPSSLSGSNYDQINYTLPVGALSVDVLRNSSNVTAPAGNCACAVATGNVTGSVLDQSNSLNAYTVNPFNTATLTLTLDNEGTAPGTSHLIVRNQNGTQVGDLTSTISQASAAGAGVLPILAPAIAYPGGVGSGTLTFTRASNVVGVSGFSIPWSSLQVGTILAYTGVTPNFRASVLSVSVPVPACPTLTAGQLCVGAYFPGTTTSTLSWTDTGGDLGGQLNAALQNIGGTVPIDASTMGSQNATLNMTLDPFIGLNVSPQGTGYGKVILPAGGAGSSGILISEPITWVGAMDVGGQSVRAPQIKPAVNWATTNNFVNQGSPTTASISAGSTTFTDSGQTFNIAISSISCIGTTNFAIVTLASTFSTPAGSNESNTLNLYNVNGFNATGGAGYPITAVAGASYTINLSTQCSTINGGGPPTLGTNPGADVVAGDYLSGFQVTSPAGTISSTHVGPGGGKLWQVTASSGTPFAGSSTCFPAGVPGAASCLSAGTFSISSAGVSPYTVANVESSTVVDVIAANQPWSSATSSWSINQWVTSQIGSTSPTAPTTLTLNTPAQSTITGGTAFNYSIAPALTMWTRGGTIGLISIQGTYLHDFTVNCIGIFDCTPEQLDFNQENSPQRNVALVSFTAYGASCQIACYHNGPLTSTTISAASNNIVAPTGSGLYDSGAPSLVSGHFGFDGITFVAAPATGPVPYTGWEFAAGGVTLNRMHCEDFIWCGRVGQYAQADGTFDDIQPGPFEFGGVLLANNGNRIAASFRGWYSSNTFNNFNNTMIEDDWANSTCGAGSTFVTDGSQSIPLLTSYEISTDSGTYVRRTTDSNISPCGGIGYPATSIVQTSKTAALGPTATLCGSVKCPAGQYVIEWNIWGSGTACSTPGSGGVTPIFSWTDENGVSHSQVVVPAYAQTGASSEAVNVTAPTVAFQTALANESGGGSFPLSSNGLAAIQYGVNYAACTTGTGTYNFRATVTRKQ